MYSQVSNKNGTWISHFSLWFISWHIVSKLMKSITGWSRKTDLSEFVWSGLEHLFGNFGQIPVDRFGVVVERRSLAEYHNRAYERCDQKHVEKQTIQYHCYKAPILIFLQSRESANWTRTLKDNGVHYTSYLTALNSSWRCMWCWINMMLWMAFSSSKGYFFLVVMSLKESSLPVIKVGRPLYMLPMILPTKNLLCAVVECNPLQPSAGI